MSITTATATTATTATTKAATKAAKQAARMAKLDAMIEAGYPATATATATATTATATAPEATTATKREILKFEQATYDGHIHRAALSAEPIVNVGLAPYEVAGRAALTALTYLISTTDAPTNATFDKAIGDIQSKCAALYFSDSVFRPDDAIRVVAFLDACKALGIDDATARRVPLGRTLWIFASCFFLDKPNAVATLRPNSAEWLKANVAPNALPVHIPGEKTPKAQVKPDALRKALDAHYEECAKVNPAHYPAKPAPKKGAKGKKGALGAKPRNYAKIKPTKTVELIANLATARNVKALKAIFEASRDALKAIKDAK